MWNRILIALGLRKPFSDRKLPLNIAVPAPLSTLSAADWKKLHDARIRPRIKPRQHAKPAPIKREHDRPSLPAYIREPDKRQDDDYVIDGLVTAAAVASIVSSIASEDRGYTAPDINTNNGGGDYGGGGAEGEW